MTRRIICILAVALALIVMVACVGGGSSPINDQPSTTANNTSTPISITIATPDAIPTATAVSTPTATPYPTPTPTPIPTPVPTATSVPVPTSTPSQPTPAQIFAKTSPAVAYIETRSSSGTALLVNGGYLVTNAHIVWPNDGAQVTFPDGTFIRRAPLVGWDLLADLAVLGPVSVSAQPLALAETATTNIGSEVLTIGYPGSPGDPPQPTLGRGIVSRFREWPETGLTYIQSDSAIEGGHSGGALVSSLGEVIGVTTYSIGEANHTLSLASSDLTPRMLSLIAGNEPPGIGARLLPKAGGGIRHLDSLGTFWDTTAYIIEEPAGTNVEVAVNSDQDVDFTVYDSLGEETLYVDDHLSGLETGSVTIDYEQPYFLVVSQFGEDPTNFTLDTTHSVVPIPDPDDDRRLRIGQSVLGNVDYPGDIDTYTVRIRGNQKVEISTTSLPLDTFLLIDFSGASDEQIIIDDDSGGGMFGLDSRIVYSASHAGDFIVAVHDNYNEISAYTLEITSASPSAQLTSTTRADLFGDSTDGSTDTLGFGLYELRTALNSLPASFEEVDPEAEGLSAADLGLQNLFQDTAAFANSNPYQVILAFSGELTDLDRIVYDADLSSPEAFLQDARAGLLSSGQGMGSYGVIRTHSIGQISAGAWFDLVYEDGTLRADIIMFRRENIAGLVYSYSLPGSSTLVSSVEAALMLDTAIAVYLAAQ